MPQWGLKYVTNGMDGQLHKDSGAVRQHQNTRMPRGGAYRRISAAMPLSAESTAILVSHLL